MADLRIGLVKLDKELQASFESTRQASSRVWQVRASSRKSQRQAGEYRMLTPKEVRRQKICGERSTDTADTSSESDLPSTL